MREFETGATRDQDDTKPDYEGFLSPLVVARYGEYMHKNRVQADGTLRASDNWQKGIPLTAYMKSGFRHFMEWWRLHRRDAFRSWQADSADMQEALCALMFNAMGYLHVVLTEDAKLRSKTKALVDEGLTDVPESGTVEQRRSPWWPEERFGQHE